MPDTWGVSGPLFLAFYVATIAVVLLFTVRHRSRVLRGSESRSQAELPPGYIGYLSEGPVRAVQASLTWLKRMEAIDVSESGRFTRRGGVPLGASDLDSSVLMAAGDQLTAAGIQSHHQVRSALAAMQRDLEQRGLLVSRDGHESMRKGVWVLTLLFSLGLYRLFSGLVNDKPVLYLVITLLVLLVILIVMFARRPRLTRAGQAALSGMVRKFEHLKPAYRPSWNTYDPAMTAVAVGLFGTALLWDADPLLAAQTAAIHQRNVATTTSGSCSGGSAGSGDGGGSSSSCSGGSSCGGGGGCGG